MDRMSKRISAAKRIAAATTRDKAIAEADKKGRSHRATPGPGGVPDYFGTCGNYANTQLPTGPVTGFILTDGGSGCVSPTVVITDAFGAGTGAAAAMTAGVITAITVTNPGYDYTTPTVKVLDPTGSGALATAAFTTTGTVAGGVCKFIDSLPGIDIANKNDLNQYIPKAIPDVNACPGCDYYEISLVQYTQKLHKDLSATTLRGYMQTNTSDATVRVPSYLGPIHRRSKRSSRPG